jgi:hypothetical protein
MPVKFPGVFQRKGLRGAKVGGSLLQHFGHSYFPHIAERERKYALNVDGELLSYIQGELVTKANQAK